MQRSIKRKKQRKEPQMVQCFERGKMVMQRRGLVLKKTKQNKTKREIIKKEKTLIRAIVP